MSLRTIQRLEAGQDASLDTLSLIARAFRVPVSELFESIDDDAYGERLSSHDARIRQQQAARERISRAWFWLHVGIGIVITVTSFTLGAYGLVLFLAYWAGGSIILMAVRRIYLEPRLDEEFPLSHRRRGPAFRARQAHAEALEK